MEQIILLVSSNISLSINNEFIVCICVSEISTSLLWASATKYSTWITMLVSINANPLWRMPDSQHMGDFESSNKT